MKATRNTPQEWQKNPELIKTNHVQFWASGIMVTAQMTKKQAQQMIKVGSAFVISEQAIGHLLYGKYDS